MSREITINSILAENIDKLVPIPEETTIDKIVKSDSKDKDTISA
jgi:hypothetical protein